MTDRLSAADRAAIRARCEAATPGPWQRDDGNDASGYIVVVTLAFDPDGPNYAPDDNYCVVACDEDYPMKATDADFIAAARSDVPRLLDALEAAEAKTQAALTALDMAAVQLIAARAEVGRLRAALDPFATAAREIDADRDLRDYPDESNLVVYYHPDAMQPQTTATLGDCRRARTELEPTA